MAPLVVETHFRDVWSESDPSLTLESLQAAQMPGSPT